MKTLESCTGVTVVEYCIVLVLIAIVIIAALQGIGTNESKAYSKVNSAMTN